MDLWSRFVGTGIKSRTSPSNEAALTAGMSYVEASADSSTGSCTGAVAPLGDLSSALKTRGLSGARSVFFTTLGIRTRFSDRDQEMSLAKRSSATRQPRLRGILRLGVLIARSVL